MSSIDVKPFPQPASTPFLRELRSRDSLLKSTRPLAGMPGTYFIQTWGCQMNVEDTEQLEHHLQAIGLRPTESMMEAQVVLLNTCSVRKKPEDKAFSMLGELAFLKKRRPDLILGVCGCMAQARADEIRKRAPHVDFVLGTGDVALVRGLVEEAAQGKKFQKRTYLPERKGAVEEHVPQRAVIAGPKLKAFVPIQYGCDKFCSFCIVPTTRGRERSRPTEEILQEVTALAAAGTKEVTLLGQTVNSYGKNLAEGKVPFSQLLRMLSEVPGLERIRYTSPYPRDFKSDVIAAIKECGPVMEHCHMPLQGGLDSILKRMKRLYTVEGFKMIVRELREAMPQIGLTTDIIVGFPEETEEEFQGTLDVVQEVRFDGAYCFAYSIRPDTPAATMVQVPEDVKRRRLNELLSLQNRITLEINESLIGQEMEVLVEGVSPRNSEFLQGYSREFRMVHFRGNADRKGRLAQVKILEGHHWGLLGSLL